MYLWLWYFMTLTRVNQKNATQVLYLLVVRDIDGGIKICMGML